MKKNNTSLKFITVFTKTLLFTFLFSIIFVGKSLGQTTVVTGSTAAVTFPYQAASYSWTCPTGVTTIQVEAWGGGGGGGGTTASTGKIGGGGGGGAYVKYNSISVTPGTVYTITIGAGGTGGLTSNTAPSSTTGGNGANSQAVFGSTTVIAAGGIGGAGHTVNTTVNPSLVASSGAPAQTTGNSAGATISYYGAAGNSAVSPNSGAGGNGAGPTGSNNGGAGGASVVPGTVGNAGIMPGGGGSGGATNSSSGKLGGAGGAGQIIISYTVTTPTVSLSTTSLTNFTTSTTASSITQTINVSGVNLTNSVVITPSTNFEISLNPNSGFGSSITIPFSSSTLASTPLYVRVKQGATQGVITENISFATSGGTTQNLSCTGTIYKNYYYKGTGSITTLSNWGDNANGTGNVPPDFGTTTTGQIFNIVNTTAVATDAAWTIGTGLTNNANRVIVGNPNSPAISFTIASGKSLTITGTTKLEITDAQSGNNEIIFQDAVIPPMASATTSANAYLTYANGATTAFAVTGIPVNRIKITNNTAVTANNNPNPKYLVIDEGSSMVATSSYIITLQTGGNAIINGKITGARSQGIFTIDPTSATKGSIFSADINATLTLGPNSTVEYNRGSAQTISNLDYANLSIIDGGTTTPTVTPGTITGTTKVNVYGTLKITGGSSLVTNGLLVLKSTINKTAIADISTTANPAVSGDVTVEKFIGNQRGWNLLGSPLTSNASLSSLASLSNIDIVYDKPTVKTFSNSATPTSSIGTWIAAASGDSWTGSTGIALFSKGITGEGVNGSYTANPSNVTIAVKGTLNTMPLAPATLDPNKWYLIPNPYAAPISLSSMIGSISGVSLSFYDPNLNATNTKTKAGGFKTATPTGAAGSATDIIVPSMSSFLVKVNSTQSFSIPKSAIYTGTYTNSYATITDAPADPGFDPDICSIAAPNVTITNPAAICAPSVVDLTTAGTVSGSTNVTTYTYWSDANATTLLNNPSSISTSGTYYIKGDNAYGCTPSIQPVVVTINAQPVLTGIDNPATLRASKSITLSLTAPTTSGGTWSISDNTIATINGSTGLVNGILPGTVSATYSVTASNNCSNSVSITFNVEDASKPVISANTSYSFCNGNAVALTSSEATGNQWYKDGVAITGATTDTYTATTSGSYTVYVNFGTVAKLSDPKVVTVYNVPAAPTVADNSICAGTTVNIAAATASNTLNWYTVVTGGTSLNSAPVANTLTAGAYTYYVSNLSSDGCESPRARLNFTVNAIPNAPTVSNITLCTSTTPTALTATLASGNTAKWFTVATGGTALSAAPTPSTTTAGTTSYYVSQISAAGCESARSNLQVVVNTTPTAPTVSDRTLCINSTASALSASVGTGNTAKWYTVATSGTALSATPVPVTTTVGTTDYYATQTTAAGCEGPRAKLSVTIASTPIPILQNVNLCNNVAATALTATKTDNTYTIKWYNVATGGTALTTAPVPSTTTVGTVSYYATQVNPANTCESQRAKIDAITYPIPVATIISKTPDQKLSASSGTTIQWYKDNAIINGATSNTYAPIDNGKYSAIITVNGCFSPMSDTYEFINMSSKQDGYTISVGPNPFTNFIQLNYTIPSVRTVSVSIYSLSSSTKVFEINDVLPNAKVPINNLIPGVYLVQIVSDDKRIVEKYKMIKL